MADMKLCKNCNKEFLGKHYNTKFCSRRCIGILYRKINAVKLQELRRRKSKPTLKATIEAQEAEIKRLREGKDSAYQERNRLVALLARLYPSGKAVTDIEGWDKEWHNCIYIDTPAGQLSWHIHDSEMMQFASLPKYNQPWDGHTTNEKYRRILRLILKAENGSNS